MAAPDISIHPEQAPQLVPRNGIRLREDAAYTDHKGRQNRGIRKRADQALERLREPLAQVLEPDEVVLCLARAQAPVGLVDHFTFGWYLHNITAVILVFTNKRLLHFGLKMGSFGRWSWARSLRSLRWGDVEEAVVKGWLSAELRLKYRNGKKEKYWGLRRADSKRIKLLVAALLPASLGESSAAQQMAQLCPDCRGTLTARHYQCTQCGLAFKSEKEMVRRSLLFPGGGYFYAGHAGLGLLDAIVESVLLFFVVYGILLVVGLPDALAEPLQPPLGGSEAVWFAGIFLVILAVEKLITIHHGRRFLRDYVPAKSDESGAKWVVLGVVSYAAVAGALFLLFSNAQPIVELSPGLSIYGAEFGIFGTNQDGSWRFEPTTFIPSKKGLEYGWVIRLRASKPKVQVREEYYLPAQDAASETATAGSDPIGVNEVEVGTADGLIYHTWTMEADVTRGQRMVTVYLDGVKVRSFTFVVQ